jgi:hypothetical protein
MDSWAHRDTTTQVRTMVVWLVSELVVTFADAAAMHTTGH